MKYLAFAVSLATSASAQEIVTPAISFSSTTGDIVFEELKKHRIFSTMEQKQVGSPMFLSVTHTFTPTQGGTAVALTSAILAGSTLGILPVVSNSDLVVTYRLYMHGRIVASQRYSKNFTQASNMYASNGLYDLDKDMKAWVVTTAPQFIEFFQNHKEVRKISDEYRYFFPELSR